MNWEVRFQFQFKLDFRPKKSFWAKKVGKFFFFNINFWVSQMKLFPKKQWLNVLSSHKLEKIHWLKRFLLFFKKSVFWVFFEILIKFVRKNINFFATKTYGCSKTSWKFHFFQKNFKKIKIFWKKIFDPKKSNFWECISLFVGKLLTSLKFFVAWG